MITSSEKYIIYLAEPNKYLPSFLLSFKEREQIEFVILIATSSACIYKFIQAAIIWVTQVHAQDNFIISRY